MATQNLPQLHPTFARILAGAFPQAIQQQVNTRRFPAAPIYCEFEVQHGEGYFCHRVATVTDLESAVPMCMRHFEETR